MQLEKPEKIALAFLIALLLLIGAIYYPSLSTSKIAIQEARAVKNLLNIYEAELSFHNQKGSYGSLDELIEAELIDNSLSSGINSGYRIEIENKKGEFEAYATPIRYGRNGFISDGQRSFYINDKRFITEADKKGARADENDRRLGV